MNLLDFSLFVLSLYVAGTFGNQDSTPECPEGEEYMECRNCGSSCRNLVDRLFIKCGCNPGCDCSNGFRNSKGICVPLEQCECPFNEIFTRCDKNDCQATCKKPYRLENQECPCRAGCVCNEGYLRNDAGECVLPTQCECPENELYMDCHGCEDTCANPHLSSSSTCPCYLKCYCVSGFLRSDEGKCVHPKECIAAKVPTTKSVNVTTKAPASTTTKSPTHIPTKATTKTPTTARASSPTKSPTSPKRKQLYNSTRAPIVTTTKTSTNSPTTQYRTEFPNKECPEGEEYMECRNCGSSCRTAPDLHFMKCGCNPGCDCSKGLRNSKGICVPLEQCECPLNAIFTECDNNDCEGSLTCKKPYRLENKECACRAGCVCNEGHLRNDAGECVLPIQCECPENELYMACHGCEDTCRNPHLSSSSICPCYLKCYCLSGFLRNDEGKCVRPKECTNVPTTKSVNVTTKTPTHTLTKAPTKAPTTARASSSTKSPMSPKIEQLYKSTRAPTVTTTKTTTNSPTTQYRTEFPNKACLYLPNGTYTECGANPFCEKTCRNPFPDTSICKCVEGCTCKEGYLLQGLENCVLAEDCEPIDCKQNEMYTKCDNHGCQNTCADPNVSERCRYKAGCYPGCICIPGYLRNEDGNCVLAETCVNRCLNANEKYSLCGTACPRTCSNKDELALKCTKNCVQGCFCLEEYVRDDSGVCILPENCPAPVCGANQLYDKCPPTIPAESTCVNVFKATSPEHPNPCKPGCKCKTGFLRIGEECLVEGKCCTDANSELVKNPPCCGGGTCAKPDWITGCGKKSDPKGCQCKKGYCKKSETDATCIAVKDCKKQVPLPYAK